MSLFFIKNYLPQSQPPFGALSGCGKIWDFPCFQETKAVNNKFKTACE